MNCATKLIIGTLSVLSLTLSHTTFASYGSKICHQAGFECYKAKRGDTWSNLFPDEGERNIVKRLNRTNLSLKAGSVIAIPNNIESVSIMDISPFPSRVAPSAKNHIRVDLNKLAWGAYNTDGQLVKWGPASGGQNYCADIKRSCKTVKGTYTVYSEKGSGCRSSLYPKPNGGAPMPYCMHFFKGYALHGSSSVPGYNASHGCVRLFTEDAKWLKEEFVTPGHTKVTVTQ